MEIQKLSEEKHKLGILGVKIDELLFDIKEHTTQFIKSKAFP